MKRRIILLALVALVVTACGPPTFVVGEPFAIVHSIPVAADDVTEVDILPEVAFNRPLDVTTAGSAVHLTAGDDDVDFTLSPREENKSLRLIPRRALPFDTDITLNVDAAIESDDGVRLETDFVLPFHTKADGG